LPTAYTIMYSGLGIVLGGVFLTLINNVPTYLMFSAIGLALAAIGYALKSKRKDIS
jgi:hypothetical protein